MLDGALRKLMRQATAHGDYQARVAGQIAQYAAEEIHDVPPIYDYWTDTHIRPRLNAVLGVDTVLDFYVEHIRQRAARASAPARILSLGAGDAGLEIQIAQGLLAGSLENFEIECIELSPILIERARDRIHEAGLAERITFIQSDLNSWAKADVSGPRYTAVIASQVLHHVVELEALFAKVTAAIGPDGVFLAADMIGRNGHMRWPEALSLVNALWDTLPEALKYNHVFQETDRAFRNFDCSATGFEGVRSQDILPLLVRHFRFEKFLAFGNLPDMFCDRFYGANFDPDVPAHTQFIDSVEQVNALLLELGVLKPTKMLAVMSNSGAGCPKVWKNLSPQFCIRNPASIELSSGRQKSESLAHALKPAILTFGEHGSGLGSLRSGWSQPELWGTWMAGREGILELQVPAPLQDRDRLTVRIGAKAFIPRRLHGRSFVFIVGDHVVANATFWRRGRVLRLEFDIQNPTGQSIEIRIVANEEASPSEEGSVDQRSLGLALIDLAIY